MTTLLQLRDQRAARWAVAQDYSDRHRRGETITRQQQAEWERALDEVDDLTRQIRSTPGGEGDAFTSGDIGPAGAGFRSPPLGGGGRLSDGSGYRDDSDQGEAFYRWIRNGDDAQLRALGVGTGAAGGYTVPEGFRRVVTETLKAFGGIRRLAEVINTDEGTDLPWPTSDDTSNVGAIITENSEMSEQDVAFGGKTLGAHMYGSKIVKVSIQLLQDSGFDIASWLGRRLGRRIGRAQAAHWVTGLGTPSQPQGLVTALTVGKTAASPTAITYDELVDLVTSVDSAYLEGGEMDPSGVSVGTEGVGWVMSQATLGLLRKLKDSQNRPLIEPDVKAGMPNTILGYRVVIDNGMPAVATGTKPIAFGNIRAAYVIRDVRGVEVLRLVERYAERLQQGFLGFQRSDGLVQDASAAKLLQMA